MAYYVCYQSCIYVLGTTKIYRALSAKEEHFVTRQNQDAVLKYLKMYATNVCDTILSDANTATSDNLLTRPPPKKKNTPQTNSTVDSFDI